MSPASSPAPPAPAQARGARRLSDAAAGEAPAAFAPAKVNLYLHVVGRRPDGYHLLDSLVAFADIGDDIVAAPAEALSLAVSGPEAGALAGLGDDNLVLRAARAFAAHHGVAPRAALHLDKHLPVASGIGGGSSDAAAALRALATHWERPLDPAATWSSPAGSAPTAPPASTAGRCGSAASAIASTGCRACRRSASCSPTRAANCRPPRCLARGRGEFTAGERRRVALPDAAALVGLLAQCRNDLTEAAQSLMPEIATLLASLAALPEAYLSRMSGSGATCFALFADRAAADRGAALLAAAEPGWWVRAGALLSGTDAGQAAAPRRRAPHAIVAARPSARALSLSLNCWNNSPARRFAPLSPRSPAALYQA